MSFVCPTDEYGPLTWNTDPFYVKQDKIEETRKFLEAMELIFNDDEFSFNFTLKDNGWAKVWGAGYYIGLVDELGIDVGDEFDVVEKSDEIQDEFYPDSSPEVGVIIYNILELFQAEEMFMGSLVRPHLNIDVEKTDEDSQWYINDPEYGSSSFALVE
ncbi:MAG: hypothetical protein J6R00_04195 [Lentisphaeria bacterium]|nr:hypothetical protein [Lentisphaeria bacterium]